MTISTLAGYQSAARQKITIAKSAVSYGAASQWTSLLCVAGSPGDYGAPANNTAGTVPASPATGLPTINAFSGTAYITEIEATLLGTSSSWGGFRWMLADLLWYAGSYDGTSNVVLSSQPSFSSRLPGGSYVGLQLWSIGTGGAGTGATPYTVTYTNQSGVAGQSTSAPSINPPGSNVGLQAVQWPLATGDTGLQKVESVVGPGSGTYQFNLAIVRPLAYGRVNMLRPGNAARFWLDRTSMPVVYANSALMLFEASEGSGTILTTPALEMRIELAAA